MFEIEESYSQKIRLAILLINKFYIPISTFRVSYKATTVIAARIIGNSISGECIYC